MTDSSMVSERRFEAIELLPLAAGQLYRRAEFTGLKFDTTRDIALPEIPAGQARALQSVQFSTDIDKTGFNLFVVGPREAAMRKTIDSMLKASLAKRRVPSDWVYVNNFKEPNKPVAIDLPPGRAPEFHDAMHELIDDLRAALPAAFESEDYATHRSAIDEEYQKKQADAFAALRDKAAGKDIAILRTPMGFALAPVKDGSVVPPDEFAAWPEARRNRLHEDIASLEKELEQVVRQVPQIEKEHRNALRRLNREMAEVAVGHLIEETKTRFADVPRVSAHLETVRGDLLENVSAFTSKDEEEESTEEASPRRSFERYEVNLFTTRAESNGTAPLVEELHPTLSNLIGRIDHIAHQGTLITNFRMIKPGALHRANGGFLLLDARELLLEPFSWSALKRTLRRGTILIEDVARFLGIATTQSLEPDPIPLDLKVIVFCDRILYYLLVELDPEMGEHFKVLADFDDDWDRSAATEVAQARLIAMIVSDEGLRPICREAVALVVEHCSRLSGYANKLTLLSEHIRDLLLEAEHWAGAASRSTVASEDVRKAIDQRIYRCGRLRDRVRESIERDLALVSTSGVAVGQINGLSVIELGGFAFGRPARITCRVRPGSGKVVDIEREVELGGPTHSKGVLILSGFVAGRYALEAPMSLFASLVFEQSYSGVEGDSASSAELYALLSAIADTPLRQDLAVTGSVNQHGEIQAIGSVNEKIEGFFDICNKRGLTGTQGVVIPKSNVQNLMLREDVVEACSAGRFAIYAVSNIDEGITLLTGLPAGHRDSCEGYPENSLNGRVERRLGEFARARQRFAAPIPRPEGGGLVS